MCACTGAAASYAAASSRQCICGTDIESDQEPVLTRKQLQAAMKSRPPRPLLVVDLGVPRNVEPAAAKVEDKKEEK